MQNKTEVEIYKKRIFTCKIFFWTLFTFFVLFLIFSYSYLKEGRNHNISLKKYSLINPSRHTIEQKDFIVNIQPLREKLKNMVLEEGLTNSVSIYFEVLHTGANISINQEKKIFPASLTKLPMAIASVKKIQDGVWDWDTELTINQEDLDQNSGYLYQRGAGAKITVEEIIKELLINSDNTAYRVLLRNAEPARLVEMVSALGLEDLFEQGGKMSAKEYTRFFRSLYTASYLNRENSQKLLDCLSKSNFNEYLASGLPRDIKFSHKIGENYMYNSYSDAGIVYLKNRPYIIVVMYETKEKDKEKDKVIDFMKRVSQEAYNYIDKQ